MRHAGVPQAVQPQKNTASMLEVITEAEKKAEGKRAINGLFCAAQAPGAELNTTALHVVTEPMAMQAMRDRLNYSLNIYGQPLKFHVVVTAIRQQTGFRGYIVAWSLSGSSAECLRTWRRRSGVGPSPPSPVRVSHTSHSPSYFVDLMCARAARRLTNERSPTSETVFGCWLTFTAP